MYTYLSNLALRTDALGVDNGYALQAYNATLEHRSYPIYFEEWGVYLFRNHPGNLDSVHGCLPVSGNTCSNSVVKSPRKWNWTRVDRQPCVERVDKLDEFGHICADPKRHTCGSFEGGFGTKTSPIGHFGDPIYPTIVALLPVSSLSSKFAIPSSSTHKKR